jgi:hypothetical protein
LPLVILDDVVDTSGVDNIIAALERRDRVRGIDLQNVPRSQLEKVSTAMREPFPELIDLTLRLRDESGETALFLPDSFLGGSVPRLQRLWLILIPFPGLPKLLLSATHLVDLRLIDIPHSGYISPEAMVAALSTLTSLRHFWLHFQSPYPYQESRRPPPLSRSVLPVLTSLSIKGVCEYLDDLMARIDIPHQALGNNWYSVPKRGTSIDAEFRL